ncbi:hypothetical protein F5Y01DRAFT_314171 [Xylaria sp. FL0043]|nr:hypothetical protein F5Y01DRAFT_314171 [Xylaria sp. FL0043]
MSDSRRSEIDVINHALEQCRFIEEAYQASEVSREHRYMLQQLCRLFRELQSHPGLWTPEIESCVYNIINTATGILRILRQCRLVRIASQNRYKNLLDQLEDQKNELDQGILRERSKPSNPPLSSIEADTQLPRPLPMAASNFTIQSNIHARDGPQIIDQQARRGDPPQYFVGYCNNVHEGPGDQIIGQRVRRGGQPQPLTGYYCGNVNKGTGEQILGYRFE